jgi:dethiobiotin synthetase
VASGIYGEVPSDASRLAAAAGLAEDWIGRVCPQQFAAPLAPPLAAKLQNCQVDDELLLRGALWWKDRCDFLIVESAGGLMSPLSDSMRSIDLAVKLNLPLVLVAANRLGCVGHVLLAVEAICNRGLPLAAIMLNAIPMASTDQSVDLLQGNADLIGRFAPEYKLSRSIEELLSHLKLTETEADG